MPESFTYLLT